MQQTGNEDSWFTSVRGRKTQASLRSGPQRKEKHTLALHHFECLSCWGRDVGDERNHETPFVMLGIIRRFRAGRLSSPSAPIALPLSVFLNLILVTSAIRGCFCFCLCPVLLRVLCASVVNPFFPSLIRHNPCKSAAALSFLPVSLDTCLLWHYIFPPWVR
jgi:hypothetical protein